MLLLHHTCHPVNVFGNRDTYLSVSADWPGAWSAGVRGALGEDIVPMNDIALNRIRTKFGMLFQYAALFDSMTVEENVGYALREHTDWDQERIVARVGEVLDHVDRPVSGSAVRNNDADVACRDLLGE